MLKEAEPRIKLPVVRISTHMYTLYTNVLATCVLWATMSENKSTVNVITRVPIDAECRIWCLIVFKLLRKSLSTELYNRIPNFMRFIQP